MVSHIPRVSYEGKGGQCTETLERDANGCWPNSMSTSNAPSVCAPTGRNCDL